MRTICPGEGCREHPKKQKCRCGNSSVAAAFLWPDSEKALKSRAFRQKEKVGNFYRNYLPFVAEGVGFEPTDRLNTDQTISSRSRYDHFDSPPYDAARVCQTASVIIPNAARKIKGQKKLLPRGGRLGRKRVQWRGAVWCETMRRAAPSVTACAAPAPPKGEPRKTDCRTSVRTGSQ